MGKLIKLVLAGAAFMGVSMSGTAQAEPDYMFAATGFVGGGGTWLEARSECVGLGGSCDAEIASIVGGGDIVLPLRGNWNIQLGGAFLTDHEIISGPFSNSRTQFQAGAIGFWRDPALGVFGIEFGAFRSGVGSTRSQNGQSRYNFNSFKVGGVAEYFISDMVTIGGFGGVLIPMDPHPFDPVTAEVDTGFYAGGQVTYYARNNLAFAGLARFSELNETNTPLQRETSHRSLNVGGKVRYLTSMPGVELFASGNYHKCERDFGVRDGARVMAGVNIRLGGHTDSLVGIDRSNAIDTRTWSCNMETVKFAKGG